MLESGTENHAIQRFARVAISPKPSSLVSAVAKVRPKTLAVAARKRSAGSLRPHDNCTAANATSCVSGASWKGEVAFATQSAAPSRRRSLPLRARTSTSQVLIGDSQRSFSLSFSSRAKSCADLCRLSDKPEPDVCIQKDSQSRRTFQSFGSLAGETMSPRISTLPSMNPKTSLGDLRRWRDNLSHRFPKSCDQHWMLSLVDLLQNRQALSLEFRNRYFFHDHSISLWSKQMVNLRDEASFKTHQSRSRSVR